MKRFLVATLIACTSACTSARAEVVSDAPAVLTVASVATAPSLDGDAGWDKAVHATIGWDFTHGRPAAEAGDVAIEVDAKAFYLRFTLQQREPLTATQSVDNVGENSDDYATVRFWPSGPNGINYDFRSNPRGTHYQYSSENANFAPGWTSAARPTAGGYVVTMRIPLDTMRSDGHGGWRVQFERDIHVGNERDEWAHAPGQSGSRKPSTPVCSTA